MCIKFDQKWMFSGQICQDIYSKWNFNFAINCVMNWLYYLIDNSFVAALRVRKIRIGILLYIVSWNIIWLRRIRNWLWLGGYPELNFVKI